jgi:hypothetical protein
MRVLSAQVAGVFATMGPGMLSALAAQTLSALAEEPLSTLGEGFSIPAEWFSTPVADQVSNIYFYIVILLMLV